MSQEIENVKTEWSENDDAVLAGRWYHDFSDLGYPTIQHDDHHRLNQIAKQRPIRKMITDALEICRAHGVLAPHGVELFCSDGFYANLALKLGAARMHGVDLNNAEVSRARVITKVLGNQADLDFVVGDVFDVSGTYDFGICAGGLYHLEDPSRLLRTMSAHIRSALVLQTVYSLAQEEAEYFESPAPGWTWGCRFSYSYLLDMVRECGWTVLAADTNVLEGNNREEDRGSAYLLCVPHTSLVPTE